MVPSSENIFEDKDSELFNLNTLSNFVFVLSYQPSLQNSSDQLFVYRGMDRYVYRATNS